MILVVEDGSEFPDGNMYSLMCLRGTTYTEEDFRVWVSTVWKVSPSATFDELADAAKTGGWKCFRLLGT